MYYKVLLFLLCILGCVSAFATDMPGTDDFCPIHKVRINYTIGGHCQDCLLSDVDDGANNGDNIILSIETQVRSGDVDGDDDSSTPLELPAVDPVDVDDDLSPDDDRGQNNDQEQEERRLSITSNIFGNPDYLFDSDND